LKHKFHISYLSKEMTLYCLDQNSDLNYFKTNTIPCMNFEGKINSNMISALVDFNGYVFAATKIFKDEFKISIKFSHSDNRFLFDTYRNSVNLENLKYLTLLT
jgi:hypothetical protein